MTVRWPDFRRLWTFRIAREIEEDIHSQIDRRHELVASQQRQDDARAMLDRLKRMAPRNGQS